MGYAMVDTLDGYQEAASRFARYSNGVTYNALKVASEAGEVADKIAKTLGHGLPLRHADLKLELGDLLWHLSMLARDLRMSLSEVANANLEKLAGREARGTIVGSGDIR